MTGPARNVSCIIIEADGNAEVKVLPVADHDTLSGIVGGWLEMIGPMVNGFGPWHGYVDEEGKIKGLARNFTATDIATMLGWGGEVAGDYIAGPLVLLGPGEEGEEGDVPTKVITAVLEFYKRHGQVINPE